MTNQTPQNNSKMEKFDEKKYRKLKKEKKETYYEKDSSEVKLSLSDGMYFETKSQHKSQYSSIKKYDKISRKIIYSGQFFQKFPVGIHKEYDEKGNVTNEVNFEKHYPFTIDNLVIKLLTDFEIDINDTNLQITVNRENHSSPQYRIYVPLTPYPYSDQRIIIISGESGKLISDEIFKSER